MNLFIVPTPIGNLKDITLRAIEVLKQVDFIIAEDTRHSRKLLSHLGIKKRIISYYRPKERIQAEAIVPLLRHQDAALISDSGTPLLSDPGLTLVRMALAAGIPVSALPGPTAFAPALAASGLEASPFLFLGFPPKKQGERDEFIRGLRQLTFTLVFYEAALRLAGLLRSALDTLGDRPFAVAKEISKKHEKWLRGSLAGFESLLAGETIAGEMVLVIAGSRGRKEPESDPPRFETREDIYDYFKTKLGISKNNLKKILLRKDQK